jgi:GntR family histidine utilization transcriptional repressor
MSRHNTAGKAIHMSTREALYQRIKRELLARIREERMAPGASLPGEVELARDYGCARMTVHRALRELAAEGVVERRRRAGTRVAPFTSQSALLEVPRVDAEIAALGAEYGYRLLGRRAQAADEATADRLGVKRRAPVLWVLCLHLADGLPFQLEERWINLAAAPGAAEADFAASGPNAWLLENVAWSRVAHEVAAVEADREVAAALEIPPGAAVLELRRRTWLAETVVTWARLSHPGARYRLKADASAA